MEGLLRIILGFDGQLFIMLMGGFLSILYIIRNRGAHDIDGGILVYSYKIGKGIPPSNLLVIDKESLYQSDSEWTRIHPPIV